MSARVAQRRLTERRPCAHCSDASGSARLSGESPTGQATRGSSRAFFFCAQRWEDTMRRAAVTAAPCDSAGEGYHRNP